MALTVGQLIEELKKIVEVHPEADDAAAWAYYDEDHKRFPIRSVGYDKRHKPERVKFEE